MISTPQNNISSILNICQSPYNNTNILISPVDNPLESCNYSILTGIDKLALSFNTKQNKGLILALENFGFEKYKFHRHKKGRYRTSIEFRNPSGIQLFIFYDKKPDYGFLPSLISIHDPNLHFLDYLNNVFDSLGVDNNLSLVELAIDFHGNKEDLVELQSFLLRHLHLSHSRSGGLCENTDDQSCTHYINHVHKSSKATRLYIKKNSSGNKKEFLRLELVLNRRSICNMKFYLPLLLKEVNNIDLSKFFKFQTLNSDKLSACIEKNFRKRCWKISLKDPDKYNRLLRLHLSNIYSKLIYRTLSSQKTLLRSGEISGIDKNNYSRFFDNMPECNTAFFSLLSNNRFLDVA